MQQIEEIGIGKYIVIPCVFSASSFAGIRTWWQYDDSIPKGKSAKHSFDLMMPLAASKGLSVRAIKREHPPEFIPKVYIKDPTSLVSNPILFYQESWNLNPEAPHRFVNSSSRQQYQRLGGS